MSRTFLLRAAFSGVLSAALLAGCDDQRDTTPAFAFVRPADVGFACYDVARTEARVSDDPSLPMECCEQNDPDEGTCGNNPRLHALVTQTRRGEVGAVDVEADTDNADGQIIDGNPVIPGFTFTDVGAVPAALVVPRADPIDGSRGPRWSYVASRGEREVRAVSTCRYRLGSACGPEQRLSQQEDEVPTSVALPSGPLDMVLDESGYLWISLPDDDALGRVRLNDGSEDGVNEDQPFLPNESGEMLELFSLDAAPPPRLSVTLVEDSGYTAWCGLGTGPDFPGDQLSVPPASQTALDVGDAGADGGMAEGGVDGGVPEGGVPEAGVDGGVLDGGVLDAGVPEAGVDAGLDAGPVDAGGAGDAGDAGSGMDAGGPASGRVTPGRLRFDPSSNLLLAADRDQPLIHAFRLEDEPEPIASIVTGAPILDFVLTPPVPASVELYDENGDANVDGNEPKNLEPNDTRYIYAIDETNRSVLAIRWQPEAEVGELVRPQGPVRYADRLAIDGLAVALEVIDTGHRRQGCRGDAEERAASPGDFMRGVFVAVATSEGDLRIVDVHDLDLFCEAFGLVTRPGDEEEGTRTIRGTGRCNQSSPARLISGDGNEGEFDDDEGEQSQEPFQGVAVRRHSPRFARAFPPEASGDEEELGTIQCPRGYLVAGEPESLDPGADGGVSEEDGGAPEDDDGGIPGDEDGGAPEGDDGGMPDGGGPADAGPMDGGVPDDGGDMNGGSGDEEDEPGLICVNRDPWMQVQETWNAVYEGALPGFSSRSGVLDVATGAFDPDDPETPDGQAVFRASRGISLCSRGLMDAQTLDEQEDGVPESDRYPGDFLVLPRTPPVGVPEGCETPETADRPRLPILEAHDTHLVVGYSDEEGEEVTEEQRAEVARLVDCFGPNESADSTVSGVTPFGVQVNGRHLVTGSVSGYLHRVTAGADGRCVLDPALDPRLRARVRLAEPGTDCSDPDGGHVFQNPFVAFCPVAMGEDDTSSVSVRIDQTPALVRQITQVNATLLTLPASLRFVPRTRQLFVVDQADQGLLQFDVHRFELEQAYR